MGRWDFGPCAIGRNLIAENLKLSHIFDLWQKLGGQQLVANVGIVTLSGLRADSYRDFARQRSALRANIIFS